MKFLRRQLKKISTESPTKTKISEPPSVQTEDYDEAYYQDGQKRGTQYADYLNEAPKNRTYFEIAETISGLFKPRRTLEIGCAIGTIVHHLETFDVESHGLDVSDWAVEHRASRNVFQSDGLNLPFEDGYFDVVYSVHALEHLKTETKDAVLSEISRVCSGFQWHLMPMLESGPYRGDRFSHLLNLRTDPTHNLLFEQGWWIDQFEKLGWADAKAKISVIHDNLHYELSDCQVLLAKPDKVTIEFMQAIAAHNHSCAGALSLALNGRPARGLDVHVNRLRDGWQPD